MCNFWAFLTLYCQIMQLSIRRRWWYINLPVWNRLIIVSMALGSFAPKLANLNVFPTDPMMQGILLNSSMCHFWAFLAFYSKIIQLCSSRRCYMNFPAQNVYVKCVCVHGIMLFCTQMGKFKCFSYKPNNEHNILLPKILIRHLLGILGILLSNHAALWYRR